VRLLLDTHIWIWSLLDPDRLGRRVARELVADGAELWLSPISAWEAAMLAERGRLVVPGDPATWVNLALQTAPVREAPFTFDVAVESRRVRLPHPDPADRFLVASARVHDLRLVTADDQLLKAKACDVLANR
jgi:PIN domain nuclease of toxin-antitoxin system